ncbi:NAD(P)-dependent dehydrogenase (short-subunit alcohol dehydrogenase family) [Sphingobium xenophagum]|uniref:NAD(P)-dependent dehydrogenase (Short-subunit alcohol dehydrogenase family) n=1 Tax=Sphingobium xenophagum TaxID=121428 RepID=A0ABU1X5M8_SPHXE|nr:SDR family oxidoreductase [Sphingobium xenophagum]MDR7156880.1 NAD(P)-dependent dehydrogenase (short-subunit alcohol dehydrogenase family) [Sphingobium xenophagum]
MTNPFNLTGRGAIITGSSRGIGRAIAHGLAAQGADVIVSSRNQDACDLVAEEINALSGGHATAIAANIGDKAALENLVARSTDRLGAIDILVCNAASNPYYGPMAGISDDQFEKILRNNVLANHWLASMIGPRMAERGHGSIILIGSIGGLRGSPVIGAYNISKAADFQLARNLAVEYGPAGVRVNCIAPGLIRTDFARALWEDSDNLATALSGTPMGRIGEPDDIAGTAVFLASDASRYITGQAIVVDGGATVTVGGI